MRQTVLVVYSVPRWSAEL